MKKAGCTITSRQFKTRTKTYLIKNIEKSSVHYTFLFLLPLALLLTGFIYRFEKFLYENEILYGYGIAVLMVLMSVTFGSLKIYTRVIEDKALFGFIPTIKKVRNKLDEAIDNYSDGEVRKMDYEDEE